MESSSASARSMATPSVVSGANCVVSGGDAGSTAVQLTVVYDNGFVLKPVGINKTPFSMTINSWCQARHSYFDSDGSTSDQNDFEFEQTRLAFRGIALSPDLKYFFSSTPTTTRHNVSTCWTTLSPTTSGTTSWIWLPDKWAFESADGRSRSIDPAKHPA